MNNSELAKHLFEKATPVEISNTNSDQLNLATEQAILEVERVIERSIDDDEISLRSISVEGIPSYPGKESGFVFRQHTDEHGPFKFPHSHGRLTICIPILDIVNFQIVIVCLEVEYPLPPTHD